MFVLEVSRLLGLSECSLSTSCDDILLRILTPVLKLYTAKQVSLLWVIVAIKIAAGPVTFEAKQLTNETCSLLLNTYLRWLSSSSCNKNRMMHSII